MCQPAKVVDRYGDDVERVFGIPTQFNVPGPGGVFLGSVGDQAHATRKSSHNCAPMQEDPVDGVAYHPGFAHAWDARPASKAIGERMAAETLKDPRVRYVIYDDVGRKPNGERWQTDHPTFHVSFLPGTHNDTRPFFTDDDEEFSMADVQAIVDAVNADRKSNIKQQQMNRATARRQGALTRKAIADANGDTVAAKEAELEAEDADKELAKLKDDD